MEEGGKEEKEGKGWGFTFIVCLISPEMPFSAEIECLSKEI
jgi:hypothetical protein